MKKNIVIKTFMLVVLVGAFASCVKDDDFAIPTIKLPFFSETFDAGTDNSTFDFEGWENFAEVGTELWTEQVYQGNGAVEFNTYQNPDVVSISWIISPNIDVAGYSNIKMAFTSAMNFVSDDVNNRVEVYVSSDYDGTNFATATWTKFDARFANSNDEGYLFVPSGEIDLDRFVGAPHLNVAFKGIGSGTNTSIDGLFQINDLNVYTVN